jgi:hyperosmotically inducible protein
MKSLSFLAVSLWAGLAGAAPSPSSDAWITARAKIALVTASHVSSSAVHVDTIDGRVTLYGKVISQAQKDNAETTAKGIEGVKTVRNLLQVVSESNEKATDERDDKIKERVEKVFKDDPSLAATNIGVKSVNKGVVLLSGKARSLTDYLRAVESASAVSGVRGVASEVKYADKVVQAEPVHAPGGVKDAAVDNWITMNTKMRLLADRNVPALEISVDTYRGNVTLFGIVPTAQARAAAESATKKIDAVVSVNNELQVVTAVQKEWVDAKDDIVERSVKLALKGRPELRKVDVSVKNGVARLTGTVGSDWDGLQAAILTRSTDGVRSVDQDLHR